MLVATDHEEVGSASTVGAQGPMLMDALTALAPDPQDNQQLRADSWMLSVDNAHAVHPNYADKHDEQHSPRLAAALWSKSIAISVTRRTAKVPPDCDY